MSDERKSLTNRVPVEKKTRKVFGKYFYFFTDMLAYPNEYFSEKGDHDKTINETEKIMKEN